MSRLADKQICLVVTGGIAAYKAPDIVRQLKAAGAQVQVVMTAAAQSFVQALTFQAVSGQPVHVDLLDHTAEAAMGHIELARWADLVLWRPPAPILWPESRTAWRTIWPRPCVLPARRRCCSRQP